MFSVVMEKKKSSLLTSSSTTGDKIKGAPYNSLISPAVETENIL
jgi:hypothetical protein